MRHRDHDISLLVPLLDILEGLGNSRQGITLSMTALSLSVATSSEIKFILSGCSMATPPLSFLPPTMDVHRIQSKVVNPMMF